MLPSSTSLVPCCSLPQTPHLKTAAFTAGSLPDLQQNLACSGAAGESNGEVWGGGWWAGQPDVTWLEGHPALGVGILILHRNSFGILGCLDGRLSGYACTHLCRSWMCWEQDPVWLRFPTFFTWMFLYWSFPLHQTSCLQAPGHSACPCVPACPS